jgi:hypothetical protein
MTTITQATTFWQFLQNNKIEIPIIQRDYAQGRRGKEKLREKFLKDLKEALDTNKTLKLDFVYGSEENSSINPLDGQQRLTTLWLLHWYIAYKAGKLKAENEETIKTFKKFTYETRVSSREFCEKLSEFSEPQPEGKGIVKYITNQTWFYSVWKEDPTIQAMLNMLGGTKIDDEKTKKDISDGLEEVFGGKEKSDFEKYWEQLTNPQNPSLKAEVMKYNPMIIPNDACPIIFYYLPLDNFGLSDDLYIKMNARGKALTSFENFKADLIGHIHKQKATEGWTIDVQQFENKLDTTWTDIFWNSNKTGNYKIDEIYFAFFNRFLLNQIIVDRLDKSIFDTENWKNRGNNWQAEQPAYKALYGEKGDDTDVKYDTFDIYKNFEKDVFEKLANILDNYSNIENNLFFTSWNDENDKKFRFIPEYQESGISTLTIKQRVVFHAVCKYFEVFKDNETFYESNFKQWMRVVWNIVENTPMTTGIGTMRLIDELGEHSHDIYQWLSAKDTFGKWANPLSSTTAKEQVEEEREKANQIFNGITSTDGKTCWEEVIIAAENTKFFKGAIRFMFTDADGSYNWGLFDNRFAKAQEYFDEKGVKSEYNADYKLLRVLISGFTEFKHFDLAERGKYDYSNTKENWKRWLLKTDYLNALKSIFELPHDIFTFVSSISSDAELKYFQESIVNTNMLASNGYKFMRFFNTYGGIETYIKYSIGINQVANPRIYPLPNHYYHKLFKQLVDDGTITTSQQKTDDFFEVVTIRERQNIYWNTIIFESKGIEYFFEVWEKKLYKKNSNLWEEVISNGKSITDLELDSYIKNL